MATAPNREVLQNPFTFEHAGAKHEIFDAVLAEAIRHRDELVRGFCEGVDALVAAAKESATAERKLMLDKAYTKLRKVRAKAENL